MKLTTTIFFSVCISLLILNKTGAQDTIYVPQNQPTIQQGIDAAVDGNIVLVDTGIYVENINFNGKAITVTSHYINTLDSADIYNTVIDGSQPQNPDMASVVRISGPDTTAVICGFTIQNGTGTLFTNRGGGGVLCLNGGKVIHNRIINNSIRTDVDALGGGIWGQGTPSSHFVVKNNIIENNQMENTNSSSGCWGTGIGFYNCNIHVENNIIRFDSAYGRPYGVGVYGYLISGIIHENVITNNTGFHTLANRSRGGGIYLVDCYSDMIISNNEITQNQLIHEMGGTEYGGGIGMYNTGGYENSSIIIENNMISDNSANRGGGISFTEIYNVKLSNNVIRTNESESYGGGIYFENYGEKGKNTAFECHALIENKALRCKADSIPVLVNNTIVGNIANYGGGLLCNMHSDYLLFNNIMYDDSSANDGDEIYLYSGSNAYLYYNNIDTLEITGPGTWEGDDNIDVDPCFAIDGFHLLEESLCINGGAESVKVNGTDFFAPAYDIDYEPRPYDNYVDMGVDEVIFTETAELSSHTDNYSLTNYPNPFTSETTIGYELQKATDIQLTIYNQMGKKIKSLKDEHQAKGKHQLKFDLSKLKPGVYFCTLRTNEGIQTRKLVRVE